MSNVVIMNYAMPTGEKNKGMAKNWFDGYGRHIFLEDDRPSVKGDFSILIVFFLALLCWMLAYDFACSHDPLPSIAAACLLSSVL